MHRCCLQWDPPVHIPVVTSDPLACGQASSGPSSVPSLRAPQEGLALTAKGLGEARPVRWVLGKVWTQPGGTESSPSPTAALEGAEVPVRKKGS